MKKKIKKQLKTFAFWILDKVDEQEIKKISVSQEVYIDLRKLLPIDKKWYHIGISVDFHVMRQDKKTHLLDHIIVWRDGEKVALYQFETKKL